MEILDWEREMANLIREVDSEAPYKIFKVGSQFVVKNNAGMTKAKFKTHAEARQYQKALYVNVPGAPGKAKKTHWTGTAPMPKKAAT